MFLPINPVINLSAPFQDRLEIPPPGLFSYARYALIYYLRWLKERGKASSKVLLPDYMCAEVVASLREEGFEPVFYPLEEGFAVSPEALRAALEACPGAPVLAAHFYGKTVRSLPQLSAVCREKGSTLIEDCVHWPYPYGTGAPWHSDARLFTMRKVYGVPYGAVLLVEKDQRGFSEFIAARIERTYERRDLLAWTAKQVVKKAFQAAGISYVSSYRDLSSDPLKPFDSAGRGISALLSKPAYEAAVRSRQANYRAYLRHAEVFRDWGEPLKFDLETDVPYKFVLFLKEGLKPLDAVMSLISRSVPAVLGLAMDPAAERALPRGHRYQRIIALPLHQDLAPEHIDRIAEAFARP